MTDYLNLYYPKISQKNLEILITINKIVGNYKFLQTEYYLRRQYNLDSNQLYFKDPNILIRYFYDLIMTEHERIKLQSLNILKNGALNKHSKCNKYKKNYSSVLLLPRQIQFTPSHVSTASISTFFKLDETELDSDSLEIYANLKYRSLTKYNFITKGKRIYTGSKK